MMMMTTAFPSYSSTETYSIQDLPASPTAALWKATEEEKTFRRQTRKAVTFGDDVKSHDGLTARNALLDKLITYYFVEQTEVSELDILRLTGQDINKIAELHVDLLDLALRIEESVATGKNCAPVLPKGGGLCTKLCPPHVPYVRVLARVVDAAKVRMVRATQALSS